MYPYIRCFCGRTLGQIYDAYLAYKEALIKEKTKDINKTVDVPLAEVFEALHIDLECCRSRLLTQVEYKELLFGE